MKSPYVGSWECAANAPANNIAIAAALPKKRTMVSPCGTSPGQDDRSCGNCRRTHTRPASGALQRSARSFDYPPHEPVQRRAMPGAARGLAVVGHHGHCEVQRGHDIEHLPAKAPGVAHLLAGDLAREPAVAVAVAVEARDGARLPGCADPFLRHQPLAAQGPPTAAVDLAEGQQRSRAHGHVVAAEVDALRVAGPGGDLEPFLRAKPLARQLQGGAPAG